MQPSDLCHAIAQLGGTSSDFEIIKLVLKNKSLEEQHSLNEQLLEEQLRANHNLASDQSSSARRLHDKQAELTREIYQKQEDLTLEIHGKQIALSKKLAIFAFIGALLGALIAATASMGTIYLQAKMKNTVSQEVSASQSSALHKKTAEPLPQKEDISTNASSPNPTLNQTTNRGVKLDKGKVNK
jgi:Fe2+ transport system protein B